MRQHGAERRSDVNPNEQTDLGRLLAERLSLKYVHLHPGAMRRWIDDLVRSDDDRRIGGISVQMAVRNYDPEHLMEDLEFEIVSEAFTRILVGRLYVFLAGVATVARRVIRAAEPLDFDGPAIPLVHTDLASVDLYAHAPFSPDMRQWGGIVPDCLIPTVSPRLQGWQGFGELVLGHGVEVTAGASAARRHDGGFDIRFGIDATGDRASFHGGIEFPAEWLLDKSSHRMRVRMLVVAYALATRAAISVISTRECGPDAVLRYRAICSAEGIEPDVGLEALLGSWHEMVSKIEAPLIEMVRAADAPDVGEIGLWLQAAFNRDGKTPSIGVWASDWWREWSETPTTPGEWAYA